MDAGTSRALLRWPTLNMQELSQSSISMVRKNQLKEKYDKMATEVAAIAKAKTAADQKLVSLMAPRLACTNGRSLTRSRSSSPRTPTSRCTLGNSGLADSRKSSLPL